MKNKKKWASLLTIATSLILCIISTFGITLAFFGGNASANLSTITLKTGIEIGAAIKSSVGDAKVVPGQPVKIEATGTIEVTDKGTPTEANAVDGVVRAKLTVGDELGDVEISGESDYWTTGGDGYYYLVTAQGGTTLRVVEVGDSVKLFGNLTVSKNFTNADSGKSVEASVIFEVIQAGVYDSVTGNLVDMTIANATSASSPLYASFSAVKYKEAAKKYNVTIVAEFAEDAYYNTNMQWGELNILLDEESNTIKTATNLSGSATKVTFKWIALETYNNNFETYYVYNSKGGELLFIIGDEWSSGDAVLEKSIELTSDTTFYVVLDNSQHNGGSND